jgi:hypothetical protein
MLLASGIVPRHLILHLLGKDGESQPDDIAQQLLNPALRSDSSDVSGSKRQREAVTPFCWNRLQR